MNRIVKFFGIVAVGLQVAVNVQAQTGAESGTKYGKGQDSIRCVRNLSIYQSDFLLKNYDEAIVYWRKVWNECPLSSLNLTVQGAQMYRYYIDRELDSNKKAALIDTLLQVWERGIALRPQAANYPEYYVQDMQRYAGGSENQPKLLKMYENLMASQKEKTSPKTYAEYMNIIFSQNREGTLSDEDLLDTYNRVNDNLTDAIKKTNDEKIAEDLARARDMFDDILAASSAASCENLLKIYDAKYDDYKDDAEFLRKLTRMLTRKECTDSKLYEKAAERQYELNPSSDAAYSMAMLFLRKENFDKGVEYFEYAIASETNSFDKARYHFLLGNIMLTKSKYTEAKRHALEASKLRPDWGEPYILLSNTYVTGTKCGEDEFEQKYVFLVAVDKLQRARTIDPDIAAKVDPLIRRYSEYFPKKEEGFFRGINEGSTVNVGCWINESTKVRYNN